MAARAPSSIGQLGEVEAIRLALAGLSEADRSSLAAAPSEFTHTTNQRSVSIGLPGPTMPSHQPGAGPASLAAACASGERPVTIRIALLASAASVPQVS
jgi:hypothetical protein